MVLANFLRFLSELNVIEFSSLFFDDPIFLLLSLYEAFNKELILLLLSLENFQLLFLLKIKLRFLSISFLLRLITQRLLLLLLLVLRVIFKILAILS